jgi:hypothetical protein
VPKPDADATDAPEASDAPDQDETTPARPAGASRLPWILAGILLITTIAFAVVAAVVSSDSDEQSGERREIEELAGAFAEELLVFDPADVEGQRDRVLALSAPPFTNEFEEAYRLLISPAAASVTDITQPTITAIFVGEIDGGTASAIVVYNRSQISAEDTRITELNVYMRLGMIDVDGEWRVNDVINLTFPSGGSGTASTTTTPAAPTTVPG